MPLIISLYVPCMYTNALHCSIVFRSIIIIKHWTFYCLVKPRYQTTLTSSFLNQYKNTLLILKDFELYSSKLHYCAALSFTGSPLFYVCVHPSSVASLILNPFFFHYAAKNSIFVFMSLFIYFFLSLCLRLYLFTLCHFIFISIHFLVFSYPDFYFLSDVVK